MIKAYLDMEVIPVQLIAGGFLGMLPSLISHMNKSFFLLNQMCLHYGLETDKCEYHPSLLPPPVPYVLHLGTKRRNSPSVIRKRNTLNSPLGILRYPDRS